MATPAKRFWAFAIFLLHMLAVCTVVKSAAKNPGSVRREPTLQELLDMPQHLIPISDDEEDRIAALLGPEYRDYALAGLLATAPAQPCSRCGKPTEFIDWIYTALARGIHSPDFIVASLKAGNRPDKHAHDVYCSRCGALTAFQDYTGEEGNAPHIRVAPAYDRATRTFAHSIYKREEEASDDVPTNPSLTQGAASGTLFGILYDALSSQVRPTMALLSKLMITRWKPTAWTPMRGVACGIPSGTSCDGPLWLRKRTTSLPLNRTLLSTLPAWM
ncbi:hypothetical protein OH77DRAFT_1439635 [Trametes cingulata]|nr:hypothetical protein OH77DRAFT_1439635 [Trametes cingulata]